MSSLRDKMNRLRGSSSAPPSEETAAAIAAHESQAEPAADGDQLETLSEEWSSMGVKLLHNEGGSFLMRRLVYPAQHKHGIHCIGELPGAVSGLSAFHETPVDAEQLLYLDLETTGLGVGTGNVPFMVGLAYWSGGELIVEQAVIRHPAEERAMLYYLNGKLGSYRYLVSYNGKTFDWPVMQTRFIMNGYNRKLWEPLHLDFLHPSRSIWKNTLASLRLSHVEEERLGIERIDDVPGSLAPQLYFQFLADGNPEPLRGVYQHNEIDMLSLVCLSIRFGHLLNGTVEGGFRLPMPEESEELIRTGLWLEKMGHADRAECMFEAALASNRTAASTLNMLAARDKKAGNWQRAVLLWQKALVQSVQYGTAGMNASVELAMYFEHKLKDYDSALSYVTEALELALSHPLGRRDAKRRDEIEGLRKRKERLLRKTGRKLAE
ncbi:ribonuclease H-like domain-containing protein [Paenibacillus glycanilyticus]|uniref:ribonuclease H-like domain-containing protein n=1 Tax=Paenibacillus glycanilyticus TaxID=126569 RepID=UPI002041632E|nr:ribonuclease H-like domain-containing protein [Paenibacillus glycanilyticus]MCM3629972.1 ribonuclease H-like domain-containing protein [Paenibacillus glycanilyticus]